MIQKQGMSNISYREVNDDVINSMTDTGRGYYIALGLCLLGVVVTLVAPWAYQIYVGQGVTGLQNPEYWGLYLTNFIFWIGISHSGTLLSAILFITQTPWRRSIYRSAEAMTFFSVVTAATFVFIHMGRPWNFYWPFPYPNQREIWTNFQSPLMFDVLAIGTYSTASAIFLYFGSIPDLAAVRDKVSGWRKTLYTSLALGWRGTDAEWHWLTKAYTFFAVFIIPLAVSVHSIVSWDFASSKVPGLNKTIFAPYFVIGAIYSGTAGIVTLMVLLRKYLKMERYITFNHFDKLGTLLVVMSLLWTYVNITEVFTGWYANTSYENESLTYRMFTPPFAYIFWLMIACNTFFPLLYVFKKVRVSIVASLLISIGINIGMWIERYLIIATSLPRKFLPYMWRDYAPSLVEISITLGSFLFFTTLFLLFVKYWPSFSIYEIKEDIGIPMEKKGR